MCIQQLEILITMKLQYDRTVVCKTLSGISVKLIMVIKIVIEIKSKVADCFLRANVLERSTANIQANLEKPL